jgi:hypothetical protein
VVVERHDYTTAVDPEHHLEPDILPVVVVHNLRSVATAGASFDFVVGIAAVVAVLQLQTHTASVVVEVVGHVAVEDTNVQPAACTSQL